MHIPYFLNLYAIAIAMDKNKLSYGKSTIGQHFALWFTVLGLLSLLFVLITSPNIFIHYNNSGDYFYLLLIPSIILVGLYLIVLLLSMTFKALGKDFLHGRAVPILMGIEFIFATVIIFANVDNTNFFYPLLLADFLVNTKVFKEANDTSFVIYIKGIATKEHDSFVNLMQNVFPLYFKDVSVVFD